MRKEARIRTSVWRNRDFTALPLACQGLYWMLLSQADITLAGVIPHMPVRWATLCGDTVDAVETNLSQLEAERFVVVDRDTHEVCIRSFVRHDGATATIKVRRGLWSAWTAILSEEIREIVLDQLDDEHITEAEENGWVDGLGKCGFTGLNHRRKHLLAERDGGWVCAYCESQVRPECHEFSADIPQAEVDHVIARAAGGPDVLANMALACQECNAKKSDRSISEFRKDHTNRGIPEDEIGVSPGGPSRARPPSSVLRPPSSDLGGKPPSRDELFEKVAEVCGINWQSGLTKSERGEINNAVKQLRDIGATAEQIDGKARAYRRKWERVDLTPSALVKHWSKVEAVVPDSARATPPSYDPDEAEARFRALTGEG